MTTGRRLGDGEERTLLAERDRLRGQLAELRRTAQRLEEAMLRARAAMSGAAAGPFAEG